MRPRTALTADFRFKATPGMRAALWLAADRDCTTACEFVRRAVLDKLRGLGLDVTAGKRTADSAVS